MSEGVCGCTPLNTFRLLYVTLIQLFFRHFCQKKGKQCDGATIGRVRNLSHLYKCARTNSLYSRSYHLGGPAALCLTCFRSAFLSFRFWCSACLQGWSPTPSPFHSLAASSSLSAARCPNDSLLRLRFNEHSRNQSVTCHHHFSYLLV